MADLPTKAQAELLAWLVAREDESAPDLPTGSRWHEFSGGSLIPFYRARKVRQMVGELEDRGESAAFINLMAESTRGGYADHGWRRAGGTALANLAKRGFVEQARFVWGTPQYVLTDEGRDALARYTIEPGQLRRVHALAVVLVIEPVQERTGWWWVSGSEFPDNVHAIQESGSTLRAGTIVPPSYFASDWPWHSHRPPELRP